jgi:uncharacterized membrane-anchored protein YitT (DUF2179 family)
MTQKKFTNTVRKELPKFIFSTIGIIILCLSINFISWKFKLVSGGLPGYGLIVSYSSKISLGTFLLAANTLILFLAFMLVGKTVGIRGIYGYVFLSIFIDFSRNFFHLTQNTDTTFVQKFLLLFVQGLIAPIGISLVIANRYSFGSYSSIHPIVNKFIKISAPLFFVIMDIILSIITAVMFGLETGLLLLVNSLAFFVSFNYTLKIFKRYIHN